MSLITDGFLKRAKLTIPAAQVGSGGVSNYSVVIDGDVIGAGHPFWSGVQADGGDIRFSVDEDGETRLAVDIISLDTGAETCEINLGQVSLSSVVVNEFYIWWDHASSQSQPAAGAAFGQHAVYESANVARWDMSLTAGAVNDRTSNANHGTRAGAAGANNLPQEVAGKVGEALSFDGTDDRASFTELNLGAEYTAIIWAKPTANPGDMIALGSGNSNSYLFDFSTFSGAGTLWFSNVASGASMNTVPSVWIQNEWHQYAVSVAAGTGVVYKDSDAVGMEDATTSGNFTLGQISGRQGTGLLFKGQLDEIKLYNRALSPAEIETYFNNTNSPSTFASLGAEESVGGIVNTRPFDRPFSRAFAGAF